MRLGLLGGMVFEADERRLVHRDVWIDGDRLVEAPGSLEGWDRRDCRGKVVCPGFVDLHGALADVVADGAAARDGGFLGVLASCDHPTIVDRAPVLRDFVRRTAAAPCRVAPVAALTLGLEGKELGDLAALQDAGAVAVSQGLAPIRDSRLLAEALEYAAQLGLPVHLRPSEPDLEDGGVIAEGPSAPWWGLPAVPSEAEAIGVWRLALLSRRAGAAIHLTHLWSRTGVEAVRIAQRAGFRVTASTTVAHLACGQDLLERCAYDGRARVVPPLGEDSDRAALAEGLRDGTVAAVATDHRPWPRHAKCREHEAAPPGVEAYATAFTMTLAATRDLPTTLAALCAGPRAIAGLPPRGLRVGEPGECVVVDPDAAWVIDDRVATGSGDDNPWRGQSFVGRVVATASVGSGLRASGGSSPLSLGSA